MNVSELKGPDLSGRSALVTGAGRGIGRAIALELARHGAQVAINYSRSSAEAEALAQEITAFGGTALAVQFDVSNEEQVEKGFATIAERFGGLQILVNNAGVAVDGLLLRTKLSDWDRTIGINLSGAFLCSRSAVRPMMKAKWGRIINLSSIIGEMGNAGQAAYSASKSGLFGLTKSLAKELGSRNITVNAVAPGFIETDMTQGMSAEQREAMLNEIPLGRLGTVEDVAGTILFLCSNSAGYITGEILAVNGGMHM
jgi:3-oxoacyl-[acyl-carrier protein] reductase